MELMHFDDDLVKEIPVTIGAAKYVLREATVEDACKWRNYQARQTKWSEGKMIGVGDLAESEPMLVSYCLYNADPDSGKLRLLPNGLPDKQYLVPLPVIKTWPAARVRTLFEKAKEISDLGEGENPVRKVIIQALERGDVPCGLTLYLFREWADNLCKEDNAYKPLHDLVKETPEERAKN